MTLNFSAVKVGSAVNNKNHRIVKNKPAIQKKQNFSWNFLSYNSQETLGDVRDNGLTVTLPKTIGSFKEPFLNVSFKVRKEGHRSKCH